MKSIVVPIGPPIINATLDEVEHNPNMHYETLSPWLEMDKLNIARRSMGRVFSLGFTDWKENVRPNRADDIHRVVTIQNRYTFSEGASEAEPHLARLLTAIAHHYRHNKESDKLSSVISLLNHLRPFLDEHGTKFADGELQVEED